MSHSVHERLRELEAEVRNLQFLTAADIRARGRRRGRQQMAAVTAAGVVVAAAAGITFAWPQQRTVPVGDRPAIGGVRCDLTLPDSPEAVKVRVLDGGAAAGLSDAAAAELRARRFGVLSGAAGEDRVGATVLRYGPAAIGAATLLRAVVVGEVTMRFDPDRRDKTIDLILGPAFTRLATTTELNQNLVAAGEPSAPPQCAAGPRTPGR